MLGPNAGHALAKPAEGLNLQAVRAAWAAPFLSDDPEQGGCPNV